MIPENENVCVTAEATVTTTLEPAIKPKPREETEVASVTAWKRYERFVSLIESRGEDYNRKSAIEAMFRGGDLVYASH